MYLRMYLFVLNGWSAYLFEEHPRCVVLDDLVGDIFRKVLELELELLHGLLLDVLIFSGKKNFTIPHLASGLGPM